MRTRLLCTRPKRKAKINGYFRDKGKDKRMVRIKIKIIEEIDNAWLSAFVELKHDRSAREEYSDRILFT